MLAAAKPIRLVQTGFGDERPARHAEFILSCIGLERHGESEAIVRCLADGREMPCVDHMACPGLRRQEVGKRLALRFRVGMQIDQARVAAGHGDHFV